ncbi:MAG: hypothetical protein ASARMPREDX12_009212 [Alectoria sarmentosa]|nr:MAG: hypothetical protein ASARMPREDX12_009212 [Alectoria sarmentosa]
MSGWGWFILVLVLLIPISAFGWIGYSRLKAQRAGRDPPPLSSYIPWKRDRRADTYPAPSGVIAWVKSKIQGSGSRSGAYEQPLGPGARRGLDPDEAWDARVGAEADGYGAGAGGYYEEQELGLRPPASGAYAGGGYGGGSQALPDYGEERGRSISRAGGPHIGGGQKGLDERYDEEMGQEDPFGDEAERSELRGVSPRPHEDGKSHAKQGSGGGPQDDSPTERRSMFHENV